MGRAGSGPFIAYAPVQTDKTKESMVELDKELRGILGPQPITEEELTKAQKNQTLSCPARGKPSAQSPVPSARL